MLNERQVALAVAAAAATATYTITPSASIAMQSSNTTPERSLQHGVDAAAGIQDILKIGPAGRAVNLHLACVLTKLLHLLLSHEQHHRRRKLVREVLSARVC